MGFYILVKNVSMSHLYRNFTSYCEVAEVFTCAVCSEQCAGRVLSVSLRYLPEDSV